MTITSLAMYLITQRITLTDKIAVGQGLLQDPSFHLGRFLLGLVCCVTIIETVGALLLLWLTAGKMTLFSAFFHSISAFCNAGFALYPDSLSYWITDLPVNLVFMALIITGGIGFFVLIDIGKYFMAKIGKADNKKRPKLTWYSQTVLKTSLGLIIGGAAILFFSEVVVQSHPMPAGKALIPSFFQSVSCRTAGFNTVEISSLTNGTLLLMIFLMFIGAAPGSCGGGIKVTTFRALVAFAWAELRGKEQTVIGPIAVDRKSVRKALSLFFFSAVIISIGTLCLSITETGHIPHNQTRGKFLEITFEVVSAFGTAGITTGLTSTLSAAGKVVLIGLMFIGRLGPLLFLGVLHKLQSQDFISRPEKELLIG